MPETRKFRWWVILLALVLLLVGLPWAGFPIRKGATHWFCENCGVRRVHKSFGPYRRQSLEETDLSRWYANHYPSNCNHAWHFNHSVQRTIWPPGLYAGASGSYPTPPIVFLHANDKADLDRRFKEDSLKCKAYIADQLRWKVED